ncbi:hypothetical protein [Pararhizobium mangrovi]|uniref:Uncharacterized protein n=1 Tax=Pararhizobium mangrovi TaxID=2590452 RepID=A0A506TW34_9HYPH|nr:hypothetical protein [Pararhizobium mangrovi]TPW26282.1 hypothetical protein FJU11_15570 [Pararhizobium mangrovi]
MTGRERDEAPEGGEAKDARKARLSAQLRANLKRRKAQAKARRASDDDGGSAFDAGSRSPGDDAD